MIKAFIIAWKKAFDFKGVTSRKDFWLYELASFILLLLLNIFENIITNIQYILLPDEDVYEYSIFVDILAIVGQVLSIVIWLLALGSIVVGISISIRRLRDISKKWTWIFLNLIPILGQIYFYLYFMTRPTTIISRLEKSEKVKDKKNNSKKLKETPNKEVKEEKSLKEKLSDLKELFDQNLISEEEYNNLKRKLLDL